MKSIQRTLVIVMAVCSIFACRKKRDEIDPNALSQLTVMQSIPGVAKFDVYLSDSILLAEDLAYGQSINYRAVKTADYKIQLYPAGNKQTRLLETPISLGPNRSYSIFLTTDDKKNAVILSTSDNLSVPSPGKAKVRLAILSDLRKNATSNPFSVDIVVDKKTVYSNVKYRDILSFIELEAGERIVDVQLAGTGVSLLNGNPYKLDARTGQIITIGLSGAVDNIGFTIYQNKL
jgi:hypothetical protein